MNKTQAGRLLTVAHFLRTQVRKEHFDQRVYSRSDKRILNLYEPSCGTAACVFGWCTVIFPRRFTVGGCTPRYDNQFRFWMSFDGRFVDWCDLAILWSFGINELEAQSIFGWSPTTDYTAKRQARVIEKIVKSHGYVYADQVA